MTDTETGIIAVIADHIEEWRKERDIAGGMETDHRMAHNFWMRWRKEYGQVGEAILDHWLKTVAFKGVEDTER